MIKEVKIEGLLRKRRNLSWKINGFKFLYGKNGIGKTTVLDSIYYALTNEKDVFNFTTFDKTRQSTIECPRKLPYEKLSIVFKERDGDKEISLIGDLKNESNESKISKVISVLPKEEGGSNTFIGDKDLLQRIKDWIFIVKKEFYDSGGEVNFASIKAKIKRAIENDRSHKQTLDSLYASITNKTNENSRKDFMNQYDVLYLTTERIMPELTQDHYRKNQNAHIFKSPYKCGLVKTIKEVMEDFKNTIDEFKSCLDSIFSDSIKDVLLNENNLARDGELKEVSLLSDDREIIIQIILEHLGVNKDKKITFSRVAFNSAPLTYKLVELTNHISTESVKIIKNVDNFVKDLNDFLETNNKEVIWKNKSDLPDIKDENTNLSKKINEYHFSQGERQIVTILSNLHFFKKDKMLILADEIEISLSIDWQEMLYEKISKMENVELIGVTHSPFVVSREDFKSKISYFGD